MYSVMLYDNKTHRHKAVGTPFPDYLGAVRKAEKLARENPDTAYTIIYNRPRKRAQRRKTYAPVRSHRS